MDIESLYSSTLQKIKETFRQIKSKPYEVYKHYKFQLEAIEGKLCAFAEQAKFLYLYGPSRNSDVPPDIAQFYKEIAIRVLDEINIIATLLNPDNIISVTDKKIQLEYNGETFIITIQTNGIGDARQARINILIGEEGNKYIESATNFAQARGISWDKLIEYAESLTHAANDSAAEVLAKRFSIRIDLDSLTHNGMTRYAGVLDITSPYILIMLALRDQKRLYHTTLFGVSGDDLKSQESDFFTQAKKLLALFGIHVKTP